MNHPRVKALQFVVEHDPSVDYSHAAPLSHREQSFDVRVENERVCFTMKTDHATEEEARDAVSAYIAAWEFEAGLQNGPNKFELRFDCADIEDRNPATGEVSLRPRGVRFHFKIGDVRVTLGKPRYPSPPTTGLSLSPDVRSMFERYQGYLQGQEPLPSMAYFCLTVLENSTGHRRGGRKVAATLYQIDNAVLDQLGHLSSKKGGTGARKAEGVNHELSLEDKRFLEQAVKTIIRRVAEVAHDPKARVQPITMRDFPAI